MREELILWIDEVTVAKVVSSHTKLKAHYILKSLSAVLVMKVGSVFNPRSHFST